jgi:hypothetical protein
LTQWPLHHWSKHFGSFTMKGSEIFLFTIWTSSVSKNSEFYVDFKNINLPLWQNAPKKRYSRTKISVCTKVAPCVVKKSFFLEYR